jgi:hypothetical protein
MTASGTATATPMMVPLLLPLLSGWSVMEAGGVDADEGSEGWLPGGPEPEGEVPLAVPEVTVRRQAELPAGTRGTYVR